MYVPTVVFCGGHYHGSSYNTATCGWDGGDCCRSTCESLPTVHEFACGEEAPFECLDPLRTDANTPLENCEAEFVAWVGDGAFLSFTRSVVL